MKILLADDHQLIRDGLRSMLSGMLAQPLDFLEASSFEQAQAQLAGNGDTLLVIIDMRMSGAVDSKRVELFAREFSTVPIVVLSGFLHADAVRTLLRLPSVYAVATKEGNPDLLRFVVTEALAGRRVGDANQVIGLTQGAMPPVSKEESLAPRLQEIYAMLREGKSNKAIAWDLQLSEGTVKNYVSSIYKQLKVHNRIQAAWKDTGADAGWNALGQASYDRT